MQSDVARSLCKIAHMDSTIEAQRELLRLMMRETDLDLTGLARKAGLAPSTLTRFMNNDEIGHALSARTLARLNGATGVAVPVPSASSEARVPVLGYVGAGEQIFPFKEDELNGPLEHVPTPPGGDGDLAAWIVRGASMVPAFWDGDILYNTRPATFDRAECLYKQCVLRLVGGQMLVKHILPGSTPTTFTLMSFNAAPMLEAEIEWAAPVQYHDMTRRNSKAEMALLTRPKRARKRAA